jgi:hypothetical protein
MAAYKKFKLLEREAPYICADRLDYAFREFPKSLAARCFNNLTVKNGIIVFKNKSVAQIFAKNYLQLQIKHWGGFEAVSRYKLFGNLLRRALKRKIIKFTDFWENDDFVLEKLEKSKDGAIQRCLKILSNKSLRKLPKSNIAVGKKFRYIDPEFIFNNKIVKLSTVDKKFKNEIKNAKINNDRGIAVPLAAVL